MKRLLLAALVMFTQAACSARAADEPGEVLIALQYATAQMLLRNGDIANLDEALEPAVEPQVFSQLSPARQHEIAQLYARGASASGQWSKAHHGYQLATQWPRASADDWNSRLHTAILAGDGTDVLATFSHQVDERRSVLKGLDERALYDLDSLVSQSPEATQARLALGQEMQREQFQPNAPYEDASVLWLHYVQVLLERGDAEGASIAATHIDNPMVMMAMQSDRRFDALIARDPHRFDPKAAAERNLAAAQRAAASWPGEIGYRVAQARALNILNRPREALALLDMLASVPDLRNSVDCWCVHAWRESVLISLGRGEETLAARERKTHGSDAGGAILSLAKTQLLLGHPADARKTLKIPPAEGLGLRGQMDLARTAACAAAATGQKAEVDTQLTFLRDHQAWKPEAYIDALLCADRVSAAAAALVQQLGDPRLRLAALTRLQVYGKEPAASAYARMMETRWAQLRALPQVKAEVDKVGRIKTYDLLQWEAVA